MTFLVKNLVSFEQVAIKLFKKNLEEMSEREKKMLENEIAMQQYTLHDNLI